MIIPYKSIKAFGFGILVSIMLGIIFTQASQEGSFVNLVSAKKVNDVESVEVGYTTQSPKGVVGGQAIPASGSSAVNCGLVRYSCVNPGVSTEVDVDVLLDTSFLIPIHYGRQAPGNNTAVYMDGVREGVYSANNTYAPIPPKRYEQGTNHNYGLYRVWWADENCTKGICLDLNVKHTIDITCDYTIPANTCPIVPPPPQPPNLTLTASSISVAYNGSSTLTWSLSGGAVTSCTATAGPTSWTSPNGGVKAISGGSESTGNLTSTQTYALSCTGPEGTDPESVTVNVAAPSAPVPNLSVDVSLVPYNNGIATLTWAPENAVSCTATAGPASWIGTNGGAKAITGGLESTGNLTATTTYTLECTGAGGDVVSESVEVGVKGPTLNFSVDASSVSYDGGTTLRWNPTDAASCTADLPNNDWSGSKSVSNTSEQVNNLTSSKTYKLSCTGNGTVEESITVDIDAPTVDLTVNGGATSASVQWGDNITLDWVVTNATACSASANPPNASWASVRGINDGPEPETGLTVTTNYSLQCFGAPGLSTTDSVPVTVSVPPPGGNTSISCNPSLVRAGETVSCGYDTDFNSDCTLSGPGVSESIGANFIDSKDIVINGESTYTLTCGVGGTITTSDTVRVLPQIFES